MCPSRNLVFVVALVSGGCADTVPHDSQMAELQKRLDDSQRRQAQTEKKLESLEDRVFLLSDQVESQKVASNHAAAPRLPVVTLRPNGDAPAMAETPPETPGDVEYRGEAATPTPDKARAPYFHLDGTRREPTPVKRSAAPAPEVVPASHENLGVAPAPDVAQVSRRAPMTTVVERAEVDADPLKLYRTAYDQLRAGRHDDAVRGFRDFVRRYPRHDYADNAQYWLGECFYDRKMFTEAAAEFRRVVADYPLGNKAPDALLKLGYAWLAMGDSKKGRELLSQVPQTYPRTEAARLAEQRLAELGHLEVPK
jgi:tol-pal system protein YbgF